MTALVNIKSAKKCAFCKFWYDPANSNITPKSPAAGTWLINDVNKRCMCLKSSLQKPAGSSCAKYECKI